MMLGIEPDDLEGVKSVLKRLSWNSQYYQEDSPYKDDRVYTHKEVRAYGRGLLLLIPAFNLPSDIEAKLKILVGCMSAKGLPLYDRAFFAKEALEVLLNYDNFKIPSVPSVERDWNQPTHF